MAILPPQSIIRPRILVTRERWLGGREREREGGRDREREVGRREEGGGR